MHHRRNLLAHIRYLRFVSTETIIPSCDKLVNLLSTANGVKIEVQFARDKLLVTLKKIGVELARDKLLGNIELLAFGEIEAVEVATCKCGHMWLFKAHKGAS